MTHAYLINLDNTRAEGRFHAIDDAAAHGDAMSYNFTVVTDAGDLESQLSGPELVTVYNRLTGAQLNKFTTKADGARRVLEALEVADFPKTTDLEPPGSVAECLRRAITAGKPKEEALASARQAFPERTIPDSYYAWYKADLKKKEAVAS